MRMIFGSQLHRARPALAVLIAIGGAIAIAVQLALSDWTRAAPAPTPAAGASPALAPADNAPQQQAVLAFLTEVIDWYRRIAVEQQLATDPAETLYVADDRQIANEIVDLAFQYSRAQAGLLSASTPISPAAVHAPASGSAPKPLAAAGGAPDLGAVSVRLAQIQAQLATAQAKVEGLKNRAASARGRQRAALDAQLATAREELELEQARVAGIKEILDFEQGAQKNRVGSGLLAQIDELERSVPRRTGQAPAAVESLRAGNQVTPHGILELTGQLLALRNKDRALKATADLTTALDTKIAELRAPILDQLKASDQRSLQLSAKAGLGDLATVEQRRQTFATLLQTRKLTVAALVPLAKMGVDLRLYQNNLDHWREALDQRWHEALRSLALRLIVLGGLIGMIAVGALLWRQFAFRYVHDVRHRHRILQVRTLTVVVMLVLVLLFNFSDEIGALATVMGLATAGIAFALQNVILSVAGYFFLSGRYGVRVGDRIQVAGVYGTVIDIGLVKLTLMELSGEGNFRQASGRVVVFANSIVFQTNGNFFKQAPGISFVWAELRLTLAPDCDYQLAEKLLMEAVNDVIARYREDLRREYRESGHLHNVWFEPPEAHSRILLGAEGIRIAIRYPVEARRAVEINDEISRRLLNVIDHEPRLRLVSSGTIQGVPISEDGLRAGTVGALAPASEAAVKP